MISAVQIKSHVHIGAGCILGPFCIIGEHCKILPGSVVPHSMNVPPGSIVGGNPAQVIDEVGDGWGVGPGEPGEDWVEGGDLKELVRSIR